MDSQQNFLNYLLKKIQSLREEVRMKDVIIKSLLLLKSSKQHGQNLSYLIISLIKILFNLKPVQIMIVPEEVLKLISSRFKGHLTHF